jgi:hydroxymethylpyrimidine pyrophosphatase-like HAD family hydrolase
MSSVLFSDMDQTMIYSKNQIKKHNDNFYNKVVVEEIDGEPWAYMTFDAVEKLVSLSERLDFVPVTTRTIPQYQRIMIPNVRITSAITTNGARIVTNGAEDLDWTDYVSKRLSNEAADVRLVMDYLETNFTNAEWISSIRCAADTFAYIVFTDADDVPESFFQLAEEKAREWNYTISLQGRKLYFIASFLTKELAAEELKSRFGATKTFASGDSLLDLSLMRFADFALRPAHGELQRLHVADDIPSSKNAGLKAAEDILDFAGIHL